MKFRDMLQDSYRRRGVPMPDPIAGIPARAVKLLEVVTEKGKRYYMDGKRVSREHKLSLNVYRQDSFVTRVDPNAVRNWSTIYVPA